MPEREYILFCDESEKGGPHFCNFYGGVLIGASAYEPVTRRLDRVKAEQNLRAEVKWQKVTDRYLPKYQALMTAFFTELRDGHAKVRVMFRQAALEPTGLTHEQIGSSYYRLYYQFIKHAFGLQFIPRQQGGTWLRLYFDQFPDTGEQVQQFKGFIKALERTQGFRSADIRMRAEDITEVRSHDHVLMQCLDVVLGAMQFRLNDKHRLKPPGKPRRARRTIAKEKLYETIRALICELRGQPHFNIGITSGHEHGRASRWLDAYRHWSFKPSDHDYQEEKTKAWKRKNPT
ncbi:MAG: DUF3800 domain-containing protein [Planctomycetota bacterium]|nr:DUF3800 domain-containing protein [Planctomycetota bacterium]